VVRMIEPLFPCYIFVRCVIEECLDEIQYANGVHSLLHFGPQIPPVADSIIEELRECFFGGRHPDGTRSNFTRG